MSSIGTQLKINIHIDEIDGYTMNDMDFECLFYIFPNRNILLYKKDMIKADNDNYVACIDSSKIGKGAVMVKVTAYVPDADFEGGFRKEIETVYTGITISR